ncbi:MAG: hypothetical protein P9M06_04355 [Candidatus Saelkia tenebricola]|nr:hypothetical protein [Candidatus Saelkia tenebricola]
MKVKFYKIQKKRLGGEDVVVIYTKGAFSGMLEVRNNELSFNGKKDEELMDILFQPYHMPIAGTKGKNVRDKLLLPGTPQHLEAVRRSCWNHGYIAEMEES